MFESRGKAATMGARAVREGRVGEAKSRGWEGPDLTGLTERRAWSEEHFKTHFHSCAENTPRRQAKRLSL